MPEITPEKNLEMYRQCEIRRRSPPGFIDIGLDHLIDKPAGYYFDIIWIKNNIAKKGAILVDEEGNDWLIAELFGSKLMPSPRKDFKVSDASH